MSKVTLLALFSTVLIATSAQARKVPGNPLPAPTLVDASVLDAGAAECDGDELTTNDVCVSVTFTKVCGATKYSVDLSKGFDLDSDGCDETTIGDDADVAAQPCTGELNCVGDTLECQTSIVPVGTTTVCVDDGDGTVDCVNDPEDIEFSNDSLCAKVKGLNPPQKGPKAISQSTAFSNTICPDADEDCI